MSSRSAASRAGLLIGLILSACSPKKNAVSEERLRELNEFSPAQLRVFLKGFPGDWRPDGKLSSSKPEPPSQKEIPEGAQRIRLPHPESTGLGSKPIRDAIAERRSSRKFSPSGISKESLGFLSWATQGVTGIERDSSGTIVFSRRAAPSAGGRYPLETYLAVLRVEGVPAGLYRYLPDSHELLLIREDPLLFAHIRSACYEEEATRNAAVIFVWSAIPLRTEWKYAYLAHRMIAIEAGHVCENLYLAAQSCQLGACALLSYHQPTIDALLGLDGIDEFAIYMACVGKAADSSR